MQETQEMWVRSLGWEDPMQKEMATHSNILAWRIPWTEELGGLQFMESQRVGYDWACTRTHAHTHASGFGRDAWSRGPGRGEGSGGNWSSYPGDWSSMSLRKSRWEGWKVVCGGRGAHSEWPHLRGGRLHPTAIRYQPMAARRWSDH